jgi:uncharacterized protein (DUF2141 family)
MILSALALALVTQAAATNTLVVEVGPLEDQGGFIGCALYASGKGFPSDATQAKASVRVAAKGKAVTCTFTDLAPGTYAVSVMHDEDGDGELDTNLLGIPSEGYGASNNQLPSMSAPTFEAARITVVAGEPKKISVQLKY